MQPPIPAWGAVEEWVEDKTNTLEVLLCLEEMEPGLPSGRGKEEVAWVAAVPVPDLEETVSVPAVVRRYPTGREHPVTESVAQSAEQR